MKTSGEFKSNGRRYAFYTPKGSDKIVVQVIRPNGVKQGDASARVENGKVAWYFNGTGAGYKLSDLQAAMEA